MTPSTVTAAAAADANRASYVTLGFTRILLASGEYDYRLNTAPRTSSPAATQGGGGKQEFAPPRTADGSHEIREREVRTPQVPPPRILSIFHHP